MKPWIVKARELLLASLEPPRHELNELDWKVGLSPDKKRLTEHLSALANQPGGGFLAYGIDNQGQPQPLTETEVASVIDRLANLGRQAVEPPLALDHAIDDCDGRCVLFVHVPESAVKPVHLRGKSIEEAFIRSGGTTRLASRQEIGAMMLHSRTPRWEELPASMLLDDERLAAQLEADPILEMLGRPLPGDREALLTWLAEERFIVRHGSGGGQVTNLGAMAAARKLADFPDLCRKAARVIVYDGTNKAKTKQEKEGVRGYAVAFQNLLSHVLSQLPQREEVRQGLRVTQTDYPEIALREVIANALIHQDFSVGGTGPMIEIFADRIEVSNPGGLLPSKKLDRLIGTQPESRNELLARAFRRYKICEERGSGLQKAGLAVEAAGLPPIQFETGSNYFKVTLFAHRTFGDMTMKERLDACYQHAVLRYLSNQTLTNTSLRERLRVKETGRPNISGLIQQAVGEKLIKLADPENRSRKFAEYIPYWA